MQISDAVFTNLAERGPCSAAEAACLSFLETHGIPYEGRTHTPGDTIEICEEIEKKLGAPILKNLFLCNQQKTAFYLLIMPGNKTFKTKYLSKQIGSARLSFADAESMEKYLGVRPGSASILALMNDKERAVRLIFDEEILKDGMHTGQYAAVYAHPIPYRGTISVPYGYVTAQLFGTKKNYTHVLLMEDPEAPITEHGLVIFKGAEYEVRAVRPSLNVLAVGLQKRTENNAEEEF